MVESVNIKSEDVISQLKEMDIIIRETGKWLVWVNFPYSQQNLEIIKDSLKRLNWKKNEYRLNYDENEIFIEKDILMVD